MKSHEQSMTKKCVAKNKLFLNFITALYSSALVMKL